MNSYEFATLMNANGYKQYLTDNPDLSFCLKNSLDKHLVVIVNYTPNFNRMGTDMEALSHQLAYDYGTTEILFVIFSEDSFGARTALEGDYNCWFYNTYSQRLIIFEDQPYEFHGVKRFLEKEVNYYKKDIPPVNNTRPIKNIFTINNLIVAVNIIVFIIQEAMGDTNDAYFLFEHGGVYPAGLFKEHEVYKLFTSMFMHSGIKHIFNNMLILFLIGANLERAMGKIKYTITYLGSGLIGGIVSQIIYYLQGREYLVCVGASGAIFGVLGALIWILIVNKGKVEGLSLRRMLISVGLSILLGFSDGGVSMSAHIGGLIGGFILSMLLYRKGEYSR